MKKYFLLFLFICTMTGLRAASPDALFELGNKAYQRLQFDSAAHHYQQIEKQGLNSADLQFNLGNCYYKLKQVAPAIWHYERALALNPSDEDARANLNLANLLVIDKITPVPSLFYQRWLNALYKAYPADKMARASIASAWFILLSILLFLLSSSSNLKKFCFFSGALATVFLILCLLFAVQSKNKAEEAKDAILFASSAYIKSSPDSKSQDLFILHEGVKMQLLDHIGDWYRVRIANGNEGWIQQENFRTI